jgi:fluoride exporter
VRLFLLVCLAGALGTGARHLTGLLVQRLLPAPFPFGTLLVNVVGCFVMGVVMQASARSGGISSQTRLVLATGLLGGFTTYSAFSHETLRLLQDGRGPLAALNVLSTIGLGLVASAAGVFLVDALG